MERCGCGANVAYAIAEAGGLRLVLDEELAFDGTVECDGNPAAEADVVCRILGPLEIASRPDPTAPLWRIHDPDCPHARARGPRRETAA